MKVNVTELKVKASAFAALAVSLIGTTMLTQFNADFLPDLIEAPAYSLAAAGIVWFAGFRTRNVAGKLSPSTIEAVEAEVRRRVR